MTTKVSVYHPATKYQEFFDEQISVDNVVSDMNGCMAQDTAYQYYTENAIVMLGPDLLRQSVIIITEEEDEDGTD